MAPKSKVKKEASEILLATMCSFLRQGLEEVSLPLLIECIIELKKQLPIKYRFYEECFFSPDLFSDLNQLSFHGYLQRYEYTQDAFLPKTFYKLTLLGAGQGSKILESLPQENIDLIKNVASLSISNDKRRWEPYRRQL